MDFSDMDLEWETPELLAVARSLGDYPDDERHIQKVCEELAEVVGNLLISGRLPLVTIDLLHLVARFEREVTSYQLREMK